jgi:hypothetical protein
MKGRHSTDPRRPKPQATDNVRVSAPYGLAVALDALAIAI